MERCRASLALSRGWGSEKRSYCRLIVIIDTKDGYGSQNESADHILTWSCAAPHNRTIHTATGLVCAYRLFCLHTWTSVTRRCVDRMTNHSAIMAEDGSSEFSIDFAAPPLTRVPIEYEKPSPTALRFIHRIPIPLLIFPHNLRVKHLKPPPPSQILRHVAPRPRGPVPPGHDAARLLHARVKGEPVGDDAVRARGKVGVGRDVRVRGEEGVLALGQLAPEEEEGFAELVEVA